MVDSGFSKWSEDQQSALAAPQRQRRLLPWIIVFLLLAGLLAWRLTGSGSLSEREGMGSKHPAVGTPIRKLVLEPLTGDPSPVSDAALAGKVTLINFWGPWCGPCAAEFPHLMEVVEHFHSHADFQFFSVSSNPDPRNEQGLAESTREFLKQMRAEIPTYCDPNALSTIALIEAARLEGFGYPTTVLLDRDAVIRGLWVGYMPGEEQHVRRAIEAVLRGDVEPPSQPKS